MEREDRHETAARGGIESEPSAERAWSRPGEGVGACETGQGTMFYDRDAPGSYIIGSAVELSEMA